MDSLERNFTAALRSALDEYLARRDARTANKDKPEGQAPTAPAEPRPRISTVSAIRRGAEKTWLTVEETVLYLGLKSRMALYQAVRRGQVKVHRMGRRLRFRRSELDARLQED